MVDNGSWWWLIPSGDVKIATEHCHVQLILPLNMMTFQSYVKVYQRAMDIDMLDNMNVQDQQGEIIDRINDL